MNKFLYKFSVVIIGYNSLKTLKLLLSSVNEMLYDKDSIEIIYIDDGSTDSSYDYFSHYSLNFKKKSWRVLENRGRVFARNKGIDLAEGEWLLFLSSNMQVSKTLLSEYQQSIDKQKGLIFVGSVKYQTLDHKFGVYLNHHNHGINKFDNHVTLHYKYLLFGNCVVHHSVVQKLSFCVDLVGYGGEELEFGYRYHRTFIDKIISSKNARVDRIHYPVFSSHCDRLFEFGATNLSKLEYVLQKDVIKFPFLLKKYFLTQYIIQGLFAVCIKCYKLPLISSYIIRLCMLCAILKGYYSLKELHKAQIQDLQ